MQNDKYIERKELIKYLKDRGISPSPQRLQIYHYIASNNNHPTADEIYNAVFKNIPSLSKTTVYNTVRVLAEIDLVKELTIDGREVRYDADTSNHSHFKCLRCGNIYDIHNESSSRLKPEELNLDEHNVKYKQVYYYGICRICKTKNN